MIEIISFFVMGMMGLVCFIGVVMCLLVCCYHIANYSHKKRKENYNGW